MSARLFRFRRESDIVPCEGYEVYLLDDRQHDAVYMGNVYKDKDGWGWHARGVFERSSLRYGKRIDAAHALHAHVMAPPTIH